MVAKLPSDKTLLVRARRDLRDVERQNVSLRAELNETRSRLNKAEVRAREWEDRFDELLAAFKGPVQQRSPESGT